MQKGPLPRKRKAMCESLVFTGLAALHHPLCLGFHAAVGGGLATSAPAWKLQPIWLQQCICASVCMCVRVSVCHFGQAPRGWQPHVCVWPLWPGQPDTLARPRRPGPAGLPAGHFGQAPRGCQPHACSTLARPRRAASHVRVCPCVRGVGGWVVCGWVVGWAVEVRACAGKNESGWRFASTVNCGPLSMPSEPALLSPLMRRS